jgi:hypothetical protein
MIEMIGKRFGRWTVIKRAGTDKRGQILWECICDCGNIRAINGWDLRNKKTKSCGCLRKEISTKHGMSAAQTYKSWANMKRRCNNPNNTHYENYGGRGIKIEDIRWLKFENFFADMGERPEGCSIDRRNNNLGYFKENCRWATSTVQSRNQRIRKTNKTGITGVCWLEKQQKYRAQITVTYKNINLGVYDKIEQATIARKQAEQKYWR